MRACAQEEGWNLSFGQHLCFKQKSCGETKRPWTRSRRRRGMWSRDQTPGCGREGEMLRG
jgi:hypothetical protein